MDMKSHILAALSEVFDRWEVHLAGMSEEQIGTALFPSEWSTKDDIAHLWAWQQRSISRAEAALLDREPQFPKWPDGLDPNVEGSTDEINAWIYESQRNLPWAEVHQKWIDGFQRFLKTANEIPERDILDSSRYPWFNGYPFAVYLLSSYDHHQEHLEKLQAWLASSS